MSSNRKKAAMNALRVKAKRLSADQMNRTGITITPSSIKAIVIISSLRMDIYLDSGARCKAQGASDDVQR